MTANTKTNYQFLTLATWASFVAIVSTAFIIQWDVPLAWYFETQFDQRIRLWMAKITEAANSAIWFSLALTGIAISWHSARKSLALDGILYHRRCMRAWSYMIVSMVTAAAVLNFSKFAVGRYRPRYLFDDGVSGFEPFGLALKMASFPSGHAQSIWSAMLALCFLTPRFTPLYLFVALMVSASRFLTAVHFISDVIVGSFLSIVIAILLKQWFERNGQSLRLLS